jgi:acetolactate synthase-1/3 small subunit
MGTSNNTHIVTALVANKAGVLNRVSGLFSRRGYNIESLSVASTEDPKLSRMTIVVVGDDYVLEQITKQLNKIIDAKHVTQLLADNSVMRELLLIKIRVAPEQRPEIETTVNLFKAKTVDICPKAMTIELTGEPGKIDGFIRMFEPYGVVEMARTGITALERGEKNIRET